MSYHTSLSGWVDAMAHIDYMKLVDGDFSLTEQDFEEHSVTYETQGFPIKKSANITFIEGMQSKKAKCTKSCHLELDYVPERGNIMGTEVWAICVYCHHGLRIDVIDVTIDRMNQIEKELLVIN